MTKGQWERWAERFTTQLVRVIAAKTAAADAIRAGQILPERAKEVSNAAGKAIKTAALQIEYAAVNKVKAKCAFVADAD